MLPGSYSVSLTATNYNGSNTETKQSIIIVNECLAPIVDFGVQDTLVCLSNPVLTVNNLTTEADSYIWTVQGPETLTSTSTDPVFTFTQTGDYDITLVATNIYGSTTVMIEEYIKVDICANIDQIDELSFTIFPNPVSNRLFVQINKSDIKVDNIEITNSLGMTVLCSTIHHRNFTFSLNVSDLCVGIYLIRFNLENRVVTQVFVKN